MGGKFSPGEEKKQRPKDYSMSAALPNLFAQKKLIRQVDITVPEFKIPNKLRSTLKRIVGKNSTIADPEKLKEVNDLYSLALRIQEVLRMANCLIYYEDHHGIELTKKDARVVESALQRPKRTKVERLKGIYDNALCGMEEKHHYYHKNAKKRAAGVPRASRKRPERPDSGSAPKKHLRYNVFIQESWRTRREEFDNIVQKSSITEVMKMLSNEWKKNPELKDKYQKIADDLNKKELEKFNLAKQKQSA